MKNDDIYRELGNIDPDLIAEADPTATMVKKKRRARRTLAVIAACFSVLIISASLWLFVPYSGELEDLSRYSESEY